MRATPDTVVSTGWQETKTSRSRSSWMGSSTAGASPGSPPSCCARSRASASEPRLEPFLPPPAVDRAALPVVKSQAPGLRGTPGRGHCSSAATSASWASSSASPTSPVQRASPATRLARLDAPDRLDRAPDGDRRHWPAVRASLAGLAPRPAPPALDVSWPNSPTSKTLAHLDASATTAGGAAPIRAPRRDGRPA